MNYKEIDSQSLKDLTKTGFILELDPFGNNQAGIKRIEDDEFTIITYFARSQHCFLEPLEGEIFKELDKQLRVLYSDTDVDAQATLECAISHLYFGVEQ